MRYFLLLTIIMIFSCKPDTATQSGDNTATEMQEPTTSNNNPKPNTSNPGGTVRTKDGKSKTVQTPKTTFNQEGIPDACDLLTKETIAKYVNQPAESIFQADGSSKQNPKARACFFKWDGSALPNAGVMVQLQRNPVQDDVPEYFTYLISSRKTEGEVDPATNHVVKYNDWPGFGDDGAYSTEAGKYIWRVGNDWSFMIAFNTVLPPKAQKVAAHALAQEVMSRMTF